MTIDTFLEKHEANFTTKLADPDIQQFRNLIEQTFKSMIKTSEPKEAE